MGFGASVEQPILSPPVNPPATFMRMQTAFRLTRRSKLTVNYGNDKVECAARV
jgi:hypothetical protein